LINVLYDGKKNKIQNCIRIETLRTRQKKLLLSDFCKPANLTNLQNKFFAEWNKLNFDKEIKAPPGTHQRKKDIAKNIIIDGVNVPRKKPEESKDETKPTKG
jgi:hypothetical protein